MPEQPTGGRERVFNAPTVVLLLIASLVVVHAVRQVLTYQDDTIVIFLLAFIPARLTATGPEIVGGLTAGYASTLTHAFLHADWLHLTFNSAWLLAFGTLMARRCRTLAFLALFALSAIGGALFFYLIHPKDMVPLIGASGGVSGLMGGAFRVIFSAGGIGLLREHPNAIARMPLSIALFDRTTMTAVAIWLGINFIFGVGLGDIFQSGEIAWEAHVGGFLVGFLLFKFFDSGPGYRELREGYRNEFGP